MASSSEIREFLMELMDECELTHIRRYECGRVVIYNNLKVQLDETHHAGKNGVEYCSKCVDIMHHREVMVVEALSSTFTDKDVLKLILNQLSSCVVSIDPLNHFINNHYPLMSDATRVDLKVPFPQKDEAKALGAKWDATLKTWYVTEEMEKTGAFLKWKNTGKEEEVQAFSGKHIAKDFFASRQSRDATKK